MPPVAVVTDCCAFYGIDLETQMPGVRRRSGYLDAGGERIALHLFEPAGQIAGTLYMLHGYYDHVGLYRHPIRWCLERNLAVVAWDLPGHGLSTGSRAAIDDFQHYVETVEVVLAATQDLPGPRHCMGQSTGAAVLMEYLLGRRYTRDNAPFTEVVLLAPLVRPAGWQVGRFAYHMLNRVVRSLPRKFLENSENLKFVQFLRDRDPLQHRFLSVEWVGAMRKWMLAFQQHPATDISPLIIQGKKDGTVDWRYNISVLQEKFRDPEIVYLETARHHLVNESESNRAVLFASLARRFALPDR